jgi:hypothetical protein
VQRCNAWTAAAAGLTRTLVELGFAQTGGPALTRQEVMDAVDRSELAMLQPDEVTLRTVRDTLAAAFTRRETVGAEG